MKKLAYYFIGLLLATLGIAVIIFSSVGVAPWDALFVGAYRKFGLTVGTWSIIVQSLVILLTAILLQKRPLYESAITVLIEGAFLDFWLLFVFPNSPIEGMMFLLQWLIFALGVLLFGAGIGVYLISNFPTTPVDGLMQAVGKKFDLTLGVSRTLIGFVVVLIAYMLGGPIGFGTIISALSVGYVIQMFHTYALLIYGKI